MTTKNSKIAIVITAAGSSTRIGSGIKKEYLPYKNGTVITFCAKTFLTAFENPSIITDFIITCPCGGILECEKILQQDKELQSILESVSLTIKVVEGGKDREESVFNGLSAVKGNPEAVLIHDGARPFVSKEVIIQALEACLEYGASAPGITPTDTQKRIDEKGFIVEHIQRSSLISIQTPQCFNYKKIMEAHVLCKKESETFTDDTEIWAKYFGKVKITKGDINNIKITYPKDLERLEQ